MLVSPMQSLIARGGVFSKVGEPNVLISLFPLIRAWVGIRREELDEEWDVTYYRVDIKG